MAARLEALRLGPLRQFRRGSEVRTRPAFAALCGAVAAIGVTAWPAAGFPVRAVRPRTPICIGPRPPVTFGTRPTIVGTPGTVALAPWPVRSIAPVAPFSAIAALASTSAGQLLRHGLEGPGAGKDFEQAGLLGAALDGRSVENGAAVDVDLDLRAQQVADLGSRREDRGGDDALRFARPGRPPRPRTIRARARELDVDPSGHVWQRYLLDRGTF
jgi:hypothetical protein